MLNNAIIGYNGFVGSSLNEKIKASYLFNSKNINTIKNYKINNLYVCAPHAKKWFANKFPTFDGNQVELLIKELNKVKVNRIIHISTVDVYDKVLSRNEKSKINVKKLQTYGKNRLKLENFIKKKFKNYHIIRLPALFGKGLKKNILYDLINNNNLNDIKIFSRYQWYDIGDLSKHIKIIIDNKIRCINLVTEPIYTYELITEFFPNKLKKCNQDDVGINYDLQTIYNYPFNNSSYYILNKKKILKKIKIFLNI